MPVRHLYLAAVMAIAGCASGTSGTSGRSPTGRSSSVLTAEEIATLNPTGKSAYDLVVRLRPKWLAARGIESVLTASDSSEYARVFVDGHLVGRLGTLRDIQAYDVGDIQYYDIAQAPPKFGYQAGNSGVIEVRMKRSPE
jgi:hypothetical protein